MPASTPVLIGTLAQASSGSSFSLNTTAEAPQGSLLAVSAGWGQNPGRPFASATFAGNAMTLVAEADNGSWNFRHVTLYIPLTSAAAPSGSTVTVNVSGGSMLSGFMAIAYIEGINLSDPLTDFATNVGTGQFWSSGTVDLPDDGIIFGGYSHDQASSNTPTNGTELHADLVNTNDWRMGTLYQVTTGAQSGLAVSGNFSAFGNPWASTVAAFNADTGPPPQELRPDADLNTTGWTTAPVFSKVNDESDATVVTGALT